MSNLRALDTYLDESLRQRPLYTQSDLPTYTPVLYRAKGEWTIVHTQEDFTDAEKAHASILHALEGGANGLLLQPQSPVDWNKVLKDVELTYIQLFLNTSDETIVDGLRNYVEANYKDASPELFISGMATNWQRQGLRATSVDGVLYTQYAMAPTWELGLMMAEAYEHIHQGILPDAIWFMLGSTGQYFADICRIRALRRMWLFLQQSLETDPSPAFVLVQSSYRNRSGSDVYTNMLRNTTEGMAAAIGGADAIALLPHDVVVEKNDAFGQRISRNTQLILQYEAHLSKVQDPASGSYFFERFTEDMADTAWQIFQQIERGGGYAALVKSGKLKELEEQYSVMDEEKIVAGEKRAVGINTYTTSDKDAPREREDRMHIPRPARRFEQGER